MLGVETLETSQKADGSHGEGKLELAMALSTSGSFGQFIKAEDGSRPLLRVTWG